MLPLAGLATSAWPIAKSILAWLAAQKALSMAGSVAGKAFPSLTSKALAGRFAGSGAGKVLQAGLGKAAAKSPAWLAKRMPSAEGLAAGTLGTMGSMAHLGGLFGTVGLIEHMMGGDEEPQDWQTINPMSPEYMRQQGELDQYAQMRALQDAIDQYIGANGRIV